MYREDTYDEQPLLDKEEDASMQPMHIRHDRLSTGVLQWAQAHYASLCSLSSTWDVIDPMQHSFNPSIEGLRGIAVTLTMICHIVRPLLFRAAIGSMGVTIFFVLSGFLITAVLIRLSAKQDNRSIYAHLPRFYSDRMFRLGPALFAMLAITYSFYYRAGKVLEAYNRYALLAACYLTNWRSLHNGKGRKNPWSHTWSLGCEEQFYILWSLALPFILGRSYKMRFMILSCLLGFSLYIRVWISMHPGAFWGIDWRFGLWASVWKMLLGASLRLLPIPPCLLRQRCAYMGLVLLALTVAMAACPQPNYQLITPAWKDFTGPMQGWADLLSAISTAMILCGTSGTQGGIGILEGRSLRFVGRISYAWYLWQIPLLSLNGHPRDYRGLTDTTLAFVVAMCSTFWLEEPIIRLYKRFKAKAESACLPLSSPTRNSPMEAGRRR